MHAQSNVLTFRRRRSRWQRDRAHPLARPSALGPGCLQTQRHSRPVVVEYNAPNQCIEKTRSMFSYAYIHKPSTSSRTPRQARRQIRQSYNCRECRAGRSRRRASPCSPRSTHESPNRVKEGCKSWKLSLGWWCKIVLVRQRKARAPSRRNC